MLVSPMKKSTLSSTEPCSAVIVQELLQDDWLSRLLMLPLDWLLLLLMPEEWIWCSVFTGGWKTSTEYLENIILDISVTTWKQNLIFLDKTIWKKVVFYLQRIHKGWQYHPTVLSTLSITSAWHKPPSSMHTFVNDVYSFRCYLQIIYTLQVPPLSVLLQVSPPAYFKYLPMSISRASPCL